MTALECTGCSWQYHCRPSILRPALSRQLTSISEGGLSDGSGTLPMEPVVDREKLAPAVTLLAHTSLLGLLHYACVLASKIKVRKLSDEEILAIGQMTHPNQIPLQQRKCLNEAMRRRFEAPEGLHEGLYKFVG